MSINKLQEKVYALSEQQTVDWDLAAKNYRGLQKARKRMIKLTADVQVAVQFNTERIYSSSAKVDTKSIKERKCFLCPAHLPDQQRWVSFGNDYLILVNPFPIFPKHLTIPLKQHVNQLIEGRIADMLALAEALNDFVVFYNGPRCGASAPDHFHFQAGNKGFMPIEQDFEMHPKTLHGKINSINIWSIDNYQRSNIVLEGNNQDALCRVFDDLLSLMKPNNGTEPEPMLNVLASRQQNSWKVYVFPRKTHRPKQYFAENDEQILLSPASVDLGGVLITPRNEDYEKIDAKIVKNIFNQVCSNEDIVKGIIKSLLLQQKSAEK